MCQWALALIWPLLATQAAASPTLVFTSNASHVDLGETISVLVSIRGLQAEILAGLDFNFRYDPLVLQWVTPDAGGLQAELGGHLGVDPLVDWDTLDHGNLGVQAVALADDAALALSQADEFELFRIDFLAASDGTAVLSLGPDSLFERNAVGLGFGSLDLQVGSICLSVGQATCAADEPGALLLVGLGLAIGAFARGGVMGAPLEPAARLHRSARPNRPALPRSPAAWG